MPLPSAVSDDSDLARAWDYWDKPGKIAAA